MLKTSKWYNATTLAWVCTITVTIAAGVDNGVYGLWMFGGCVGIMAICKYCEYED